MAGRPSHTTMRLNAAAGSSRPTIRVMPRAAATTDTPTRVHLSVFRALEWKNPRLRWPRRLKMSCSVPSGHAVEQYMRPKTAVAAAHISSQPLAPARMAGTICQPDSQHE